MNENSDFLQTGSIHRTAELWQDAQSPPVSDMAPRERKQTQMLEENMNKRSLLLMFVLLATLSLICSAAESVAPFRGALQASETDTVNYPTITVDGTGSGTATLLGRFTVNFQVTVNLQTATGPATVSFRAANGDTLTATGEGQATDAGGVVVIVETYTVTSGTGRFAGATGQFTITRQLNPATGASSGTIVGGLVMEH